MKKSLYFALASALTLAACQNTEDVQQQVVEQRIPIELRQQALTITETRAAQNLNDGYIAEGQTVAVKISGDDTVYKFTTGTNGAMTAPEPRPCYPSEGTIDITAYYPSTAGETFTVATDQSTDNGYQASDLMFASKTGQEKTTNAVELEFEHKLSKFSVNVTAKDGITVSSITLNGVKPTVTFNTATGAVGEATGEAANIVVAKSAATGAAVIPAQTLEGQTLDIVTSAGTINYPINKTFAASNVYTVNLTVQLTGVNPTVTTANWTAGTTLTIGDIDDQTFSGSPITPALTVTSDGTALTASTDYDLTWANNVNAGTATVLVIGKDGYDGCFGYKTFTINPLAASISYATTEVTSSTLNEKITNPLTKTGDGTVAYTSSNTDVATVDATTGEVTVVSGGSTTITATVTPTSNSTYATTTASYTLTVNVYRGLTSVTSDDIGKVICSNKHIHNNINAINCGGTARAMIAYVGNNSVCRCTNGLAYSLEDASYYNSSTKKTDYTFTYGGETTTASTTKGALKKWLADRPDSGFALSYDGGTGTTGVGSAGTCVWRVPSMAEYKYMFEACGGSSYDSSNPSSYSSVSFGYGQFRAKLQALGRDVANDSYWTYQNTTSYAYYTFSSSQFKIGSSSSKYRLRFILAF